MKPMLFLIAMATLTPLSTQGQTTTQTVVGQQNNARKAQQTAGPGWVRQSDTYAQELLQAQFSFQPETATLLGVPGFDDKVADLGPRNGERFRRAMTAARAGLQRQLLQERDPNLRQDLQIMISAADDAIEASATTERLQLPWTDVPQLVFRSINLLLSERTPPERRTLALARLRAYAGLAPGTTALTEQARLRYRERSRDRNLLRPSRLEVEQALKNAETYMTGLRALFAQQTFEGSAPALDALERQFRDYATWLRREVLPRARADTRLPPELYALRLKQAGIDIPPQELIARARLNFMETRAAMQQLAPLVAKEKGIAARDYRGVIRALKRKNAIPNERLEAHYRGVIDAIDPIIERERIVGLPQRPLRMRLGSEAESASQPAPHFLPAPLIGDSGQYGEFVLPLTNPAADDDEETLDDFNYPAAAWTLAAHEGRPGHESPRSSSAACRWRAQCSRSIR
jgi:Bacterial protein of unknown function (DUF885)